MGSAGIRLFRFAGITVYLHFSWFLIAAYQVQARLHLYPSPVYAVFEYLGLFLIVLLHEFGHALDCRSPGGIANRLVLWRLRGRPVLLPQRLALRVAEIRVVVPLL